MKKIATIAICALMFADVSAQTKPKTSAQSTKPTKEFTIKYLNDKLNEYCIGRFAEVIESYLRYNDDLRMMETSWTYYEAFIVDNYEIKEEGKIPYLVITMRSESKKTYVNGTGEGYQRFNNIISKIPITKIKDILSYEMAEKVEEQKTTYIKKRGAVKGILIITNGNNVVFNQIDIPKKDFLSYQQFPINNTEETEKVKKAFLNLKSFYKDDVNPFEN